MTNKTKQQGMLSTTFHFKEGKSFGRMIKVDHPKYEDRDIEAIKSVQDKAVEQLQAIYFLEEHKTCVNAEIDAHNQPFCLN